MAQEYIVMGNGREVGTASVSIEGLYYRIRCVCKLPDGEIYRLMVDTDSGQTDLGIIVPVKEKFGLETRVSVKKLGEGKPRFWIQYGNSVPASHCFPLYGDQPFERIELLRKARLVKDGNIFKLAINKPF